MLSGIGFQEIMFVAAAVLILFGPKGASSIMKDIARFFGTLKKHRDEFSREFMAITNDTKPGPPQDEIDINRRKEIKENCLKAVKEIPKIKREKKDLSIFKRISNLEEYKAATSIFCYVSVDYEVNTRIIIEDALKSGKKVFTEDDIDPLAIDMFILPGIAFNNNLARLGNDNELWNKLLKQIKDKKLIAGLCYDEQIYTYYFPVDDHDIKPDLVITPSKIIKKK